MQLKFDFSEVLSEDIAEHVGAYMKRFAYPDHTIHFVQKCITKWLEDSTRIEFRTTNGKVFKVLTYGKIN